MYTRRNVAHLREPALLRWLKRAGAAVCSGLVAIGGHEAMAQSDPSLFDLGSGSYTFTEWAAGEPAGTYPGNMVFHIGAQDAVLAADPTGDYTGTYSATSASRMNGLGSDGFSIVHTGSAGQGRGIAAVLGLNATGRQALTVTWTGGTVAQQPREYGLRLQYRIGAAGTWTDVLDGVVPMEYLSSGTASGDFATLGPVQLPAACDNQAELFLRWKYHYITGGGARPQLRVDDITVSSAPLSAAPTLAASPLNGFGVVCVGTEVGPNTFTVSGFNLAGDVTVGPLSGFTFSTSEFGTYTNDLSFTPDVNDEISELIYVKFLPNTAPTDFSGNIPVSGGGADPVDVAVVASSVPVLEPTLITGGRIFLNEELLTLFGRLVDENCGTATEYGIEWSTNAGFTPGSGTQVESNNWASTFNGLFSAEIDITGLCAGSAIYFRAYATNSAGTAHGEEVAYGLPRSTITQWTFDGSVTTPATGSGTAALIGGTAATFAAGTSGEAWNINGFPAQSTASGTAGASFLAPTTGHSGIVLTLDHRVTGTASRWFQVDYTLNGGADWVTGHWTNNGAALDGNFYSYNVDFSGVPGADDNADFGVRIVSIFAQAPFDENISNTFGADEAYQRGNTGSRTPGNGLTTGTYATTGLWRLDNVTLSGNSSAAPVTQHSDIVTSNVTTTGFDVEWTLGSGSGSLVVLNTTNSFTDPVDGTDPVADNNYVGGEQVVYNGSGNFVTVTGLDPSTTYWARVYGYDGACANTVFNTATATANPASQTTASASPPTQLAVIDLNGGGDVVQNLAFSLTVQSRDGSEVPQNVSQDTDVEVSVFNGFGTLSGTVTGTILAGQNEVTISGLLYDEEDFGVELAVSVTAGDVLSDALTDPFNVLGQATSLGFAGGFPAGVLVNATLPAFGVEVLRDDASIAAEFNGPVTLSVSSGPGTLGGTLVVNAVNGVATFDDITIDATGAHVLAANATGLNEGLSSTLFVTEESNMTEVVVPQFFGAKTGPSSNSGRTPYAVCLSFDNLLPNTTYDLRVGVALDGETAASFGAGNFWLGSSFNTGSIGNAFTTDANGDGGPTWVFISPTGNGSRFGAGQVHVLRANVVVSGNPMPTTPAYFGTKTMTALDVATTPQSATTADDGAFIYGKAPACVGGEYAVVFDNEAGTGEPLFAYQLREAIASLTSNTTDLPLEISDIYLQSGGSEAGDYPAVVPIGANNPNGVRRVELRGVDNSLIWSITSPDGSWPGGASTATLERRDVATIGVGDDPVLAPDADGDNIADCDDSCPDLFGELGDNCTPTDPLAAFAIIVEDNGECVCEDVFEDCEGTPGGPALPGTPCDDGDPDTDNDTWQSDCTCIGELVDCEGVPGGPAVSGTPCDDGDPLTFNDVYQADCSCAGETVQLAAGNLVVMQVGDGSGSLVNTGAPLVLREYSTTGVEGATIPVPSSGADQMVVSGTATSEGLLSLSADGNLLVFGGYDRDFPFVGSGSVASTSAAAVNRVAGSVAGNGAFTREAASASFFDGNNIRSLASDGTNFWAVGGNTGLNYFGPGTPVNITADKANLRAVVVHNGQLFVSSSSGAGTPSGTGIFSVSGGLATTGSQSLSTLIPTGGSPGGFVFNPAGDVCYVADFRTAASGGGIQKWSFDGLNWSLEYTLSTGGTAGTAQVIADFSGADPVLYAVSFDATNLVRIVDQGAGSPAVNVAAAAANTAFRGLAFAPGTQIDPPGPCQDVTLTIFTDANGSQTSWEIVPQGGGPALCDGSGYPNNAEVNVDCCLPDGCYRLVVEDSFGDGMPGGGYVLRDANGERIIDNTDAGNFGFTSALANDGVFCLPLGNDGLIQWEGQGDQCDKLDYLAGVFPYFIATPNPAVTAAYQVGQPLAQQNNNFGYQFWIFNPNGDYNRRVYNPNGVYNGWDQNDPERASYLRWEWLQTLPVPCDVQLNVRVRSRVNGVYSSFGPACRAVVLCEPIACATTKLIDNPNSANFSCGVVRTFGQSDKVYANPVPGANRYQFRFSNIGEGFVRTIAFPNLTCNLSWVTLPLSDGVTYDVRVRVSFDGGSTYCPYGDVCTVAIQNPPTADARFVGEAVATLWPNPNRGNELWLSLTELPMEVGTIAVDIYDLRGQRVMDKVLATQGGRFQQMLPLSDDLANGMYVVTITAGERRFTERLVIAR